MLGKRWPSVGVVVPNHSRTDELREAIASVKAQEYEGKVCVYVVYRERPGIGDLLFAFGDVVALPSTGEAGRNSISVKRNIGLAATTEDFVAFLDDDDIWHPHKLTAQVQAFQRGGDVVAVSTRPTYFTECLNWGARSGDDGFRDRTRHHVLSGRSIGTSSLLVAGATARRLRFDERPEWLAVEDYDFKIRLSHIGSMRELKGRYTAYRANNASVAVDERRHTLLRAVSVLAESAGRDPARFSQQLVASKLLLVSAFGGFGSVQELHGSEDAEAEKFLDGILDGRLFGRLDPLVGRLVKGGWRRGWAARPVRRVLGALRGVAAGLVRLTRSASASGEVRNQ
jgi:glycosyltransferase involved in cell wall biosynthesis